jgi:hypothetical protein
MMMLMMIVMVPRANVRDDKVKYTMTGAESNEMLLKTISKKTFPAAKLAAA